MKIYLSPSMQAGNPYSAGGTNEMVQCNRIAEAARTALLRCGFEVKKAPQGQSMEENVAESNAWGADLHLPIHTNAGGGRGCVVFIANSTGDRPKLGKAIFDSIDAITLYRSVYGVREKLFYEVRNTTALCAYIECEFHDNAQLASWIISNTTALGEAICRGVCNYAGVKYVGNGEKEEESVERWKKLEDIPEPYREMAKRFIDAGALRGKDGSLDLSEDMLRVMEIMRRYFEEA